jgi:hypothetical protein
MNSKIKTIRKAISTGILSIILTNCIPMDTYYSYSKDINGDIKWDDYEITYRKGTQANRHKINYEPETRITLFYRKPNRIEFVDLTGDNHQDIVYFINRGLHQEKEGTSYGIEWFDIALAVRINNGAEEFSEEKILGIYPTVPAHLGLNHRTNNELPDIVVLYDTQTNIDTTGDKEKSKYNDYKLEILVNEGNGNFKEAELINTYPMNPRHMKQYTSRKK